MRTADTRLCICREIMISLSAVWHRRWKPETWVWTIFNSVNM